MTGDTVDALMSAIQPEVCLFTVVELPQRPAIGVMATPAVRTQTSLMYIIRLMTCITVTGRPLELGRQVTLLARRYRMQANERETCHVMHEAYAVTPAILIMTVLTLLALLALVDIVRRMTVIAAHRQFLRMDITLVTG